MLSDLSIIAVALTCAMFLTRNLLLGFPSAIFWAVLGGHCYIESVAEWDIYYFIFFASMGMVIFCMYAMYALRPQDLSEPDAGKEKYIDEVNEPDIQGIADKPQGAYIDETKPSKRVQGLRARAAQRKSG